MKYFPLVWSALMRRKTRTIFTVMSILVAFLLFGMLDSVRTTFYEVGHNLAGASQMVTVSKGGMDQQLPLGLQSQIASVAGVAAVAPMNWLGGIYQDSKNSFANEAVGANFFDISTYMVLSADQLKAFRSTRDGAVVGAALAKRFGWKIGQQIPLVTPFWRKKDGSDVWMFNLVGIFHEKKPMPAALENVMFVRWKYFDEARQFGNGEVGWYQERITNPGEADRVARTIDAVTANSDHETRTETLNAFTAAMFSQFANIGLIVTAIMAAVFFTLILLTGNTMAQAVRERIPELAVLKTIGFSNRGVLGLLLAESVLLIAIGGVLGMLIAMAVIDGVKAGLGANLTMANIGASIWGVAIALMIVIGLIVGALPALRGMRMHIVDALARR